MNSEFKCWFSYNCKKYNEETCNCEDALLSCIKLFKLNRLYEEALLSDKQKFKTALFSSDDDIDRDKFMKLKSIETNIKSFVDSGRNLYIHSIICGNGKTAWSIRLLQAYLNSIWAESSLRCRALFINVPRFLLALKDNISNKNEYAEHIKENVLTADLIVWDEIATKSLTEYEHEQLLSLINARLDEGKSNIYTSNMTPAELEARLGDRLYSRIVGLSDEVVFNGKDKRGALK